MAKFNSQSIVAAQDLDPDSFAIGHCVSFKYCNEIGHSEGHNSADVDHCRKLVTWQSRLVKCIIPGCAPEIGKNLMICNGVLTYLRTNWCSQVERRVEHCLLLSWCMRASVS